MNFCAIAGMTLLFLITFAAHAATHHRFIFWHPGQVGTTAEAEPVMRAFGTYLSQKIPQTTWEVTYFPDEKAGRGYLKNSTPEFGIISPLMRVKYGSQANEILTTLPLPQGKNQVPMVVVNGPCRMKPTPLPLYAREPFDPDRLTQMIPSLKPLALSYRVNPLTELFPPLKKIAEGNCAWALIEKSEWETLRRLSTAWIKSLRVMRETDYPAASVVIFKPNPQAVNLKRVLLMMNQDFDGHLLLNELRLNGFAEK